MISTTRRTLPRRWPRADTGSGAICGSAIVLTSFAPWLGWSPAAVNVDDLAGEVRRLRTDQEAHDRGYLLRRAVVTA
jgi:hypothetical protein